MAKEVWREHECDPSNGEWKVSETSLVFFEDIPRPVTNTLGSKHFPVHYLEFKNTILQIDTESNDIISIWERVQ